MAAPRLSALLSNVTALRVVALAFSLLFIPAFMFGVSSLWIPLLALVVSFLFRQRLMNILNECQTVQQVELESYFVKKQLLLVFGELLLLMFVPQFIFLLFLDGTLIFQTVQQVSIDHYINQFVADEVIVRELLYPERISSRLVMFNINFSLVFFVTNIFIVFKHLKAAFLKVYYENVSEFNDHKNLWGHYHFISRMYLLVTFTASLFLCAYAIEWTGNENDISGQSLFFTNIFIFLLCNSFFATVAISFATTRRQYEERINREAREQ